MFIRNLVEKASKKPGGGNLSSLKSDGVNPRLVFHYGVPSGALSLAYDSIQKIIAISTKDGRIKLLGKDNTQVLLESTEAVPSKFLQFVENQGFLLNVTIKNQIEVWDIEKNELSHVHKFNGEITFFMVIQLCFYLYVGDSLGNVSVWKLDQETHHLLQMNHNIPCSVSHGNATKVADGTAVMYVLPQPLAELKRVLLIFRDGLIILWGLDESKVIFTTGGNMMHSLSSPETKKVTSACWACPFGSKVALGYSNGEILIWSLPSLATIREDSSAIPNVPVTKLNLGYKMEKIPVSSLKWVYGNGKASRLYVNGDSSAVTTNLFQIILLNEQTEPRLIKLTLPLPEPCLDMQIISSSNDQNKHEQDSLILLLKSGHLCVYDDSAIEKYLLHSQSRSPTSLPKQFKVKLPFVHSAITVAKFFADDSNPLCVMDEDYKLLAGSSTPLLPNEKGKDGSLCSSQIGLGRVRSLYITGHSDGIINFWDVSCLIFLPIASVKPQCEGDHCANRAAVTALYFDIISRLLVSGDESGMVRIFKVKTEPLSTTNNLFSLQGNTKKGSIVDSVKLLKVNGAVLSLSVNSRTGRLAVGSDQGYVSVIDIEGPTVLSEEQISSGLCTGVISLQFETCSYHGFDKNVLLIGTKDSSIVVLDSETGRLLGANVVRPKKPYRAIFMQILDVSDDLVLLCNEKTAYVYSLTHMVQGIKKVQYKKKFLGNCFMASTVYSQNSEIALVLLFTNGKVEIRSLPELSLLKETSVRGLNSNSDGLICALSGAELVLVNGDQEVLFFSLLNHKEIYRLLDHISLVYKESIIIPQEGLVSGQYIQNEKKKGIFSSILKGSKLKPEQDTSNTTADEPRQSIEDELSSIFSRANFPAETDDINQEVFNDEVELSIDDIELEDTVEKPKGYNMIPVINKQLTSKFQAIKGVLKQKMVKHDKPPAKAEKEDEKNGTVDEIKKRYGFPSSCGPTDAEMAKNKLNENVKKLQGVNKKTTDMENTARSFSALANQVLRTAKQDK